MQPMQTNNNNENKRCAAPPSHVNIIITTQVIIAGALNTPLRSLAGWFVISAMLFTLTVFTEPSTAPYRFARTRLVSDQLTHLVLDKLGSDVFRRFLERACVNVSLYDSERFTETGADFELQEMQNRELDD